MRKVAWPVEELGVWGQYDQGQLSVPLDTAVSERGPGVDMGN